uniref:Uncharacterized protein n=1 Tax=Magallana gigas TaxID=29159 RepID=K1QBQ4_MAGGI
MTQNCSQPDTKDYNQPNSSVRVQLPTPGRRTPGKPHQSKKVLIKKKRRNFVIVAIKMKNILFIFATFYLLKESLGIYGGCMSYYTLPSDKPGHVKVKIYFLNGWKLHKGPCYNCTESDEGHDVTVWRKMYIQDNGNPEAFGSYGFEPEVINADVKSTNITMEVNDNVRDVVLMVNSHEQWEMESSKITLDVNLSASYSNRFDITHITKFNFLRRDGKPVNQTRHVASWDQKVAYISMSWSPVDNDLGHHIVCANAEDSAGQSVNEIVSTSESEENVTIEYSHTVINRSLPTTVAQVEFLALIPGPRQICLNASDSIAWTTRCLYVSVQRPGNQACVRKESPCFNTTCMDIPVPPHFMCGQCPYGKVGYKCDIAPKVNHVVTKSKPMTSMTLFPHFIQPTLPDSTNVQCVVNEQCYINIWAKNKLGVKVLVLECLASTTDSVMEAPLFPDACVDQDFRAKIVPKAKGRVECYCIHPDSGVITKVIALNPRVSMEKLLIAAGLGLGAMITILGVAAFLFILTKGCRRSNKTERTQNARKSRKISVKTLSVEKESP